jgi:predicted transcriptional regulator
MPNEDQIEIRSNREKNWFWIHHDFIDDYASGLSHSTVLVYFALCRFADNKTQTCFPAMRTVAEKIGCSKRSVESSISELAKFGIISIEKRRKANGTNNSSLYTLSSRKTWLNPPVAKVDGRSASRKSRHTPVAKVDIHQSQPGAHNNTNTNKTQPNKTHLRASPQKREKTPESTAIEKEVNRIVGLFKPVTPNWESFFKPGAQRESIKSLIKIICKEEKTIEEVLAKVKSLHGVMYAPQVYNPSEIVYHYPKIMAWGNEKPKPQLGLGETYVKGAYDGIAKKINLK